MKSINKIELHEIFKELKTNKNTKFNELYSKYNNLVYRIAFSILKNKENSEDIVQKVFLKIWEMDISKLPIENEATWLYSITKNETLNYLRTKRNTLNLEEVYYLSSEDRGLNRIIDQDSYNRIISRIDEEEQEIVSLKILSNLSFKEIAQILNKPIGTIQWKYYKSLHTLKILISNLSMFIVAISSFIIGKTINWEKSSGIIQESQDIDKENQTEDTVISEDKTEENREQTESSNTNNEINNTINKTTESSTISDNNIKLNYKDIGLLSISGITLTITIIFSIIFIKHQQKGKKNVSK